MDIKGTTCGDPTYWWIKHDAETLYVMGGPKPKSGEDSSKSFFRIKKAGGELNDYKFVFCIAETYCTDVGIFYNSRRDPCLGLDYAATPFEVVFVKDDKTEQQIAFSNA